MALWMLAAAAAYFVKGLCGFANTLVFTSILSFGSATNANISPVDLLVGYPTNVILTWKNREKLNARVWLPLAALVLAGSVPGALLLKHVDARAIKAVFGAVIVLLGAEMLLRERQKGKLRSSKLLLVLIGVLAGVLCGLFGVGALLAAYVSRVTDDQNGFKANISAVCGGKHVPHRALQLSAAHHAGDAPDGAAASAVCAAGAVARNAEQREAQRQDGGQARGSAAGAVRRLADRQKSRHVTLPPFISAQKRLRARTLRGSLTV